MHLRPGSGNNDNNNSLPLSVDSGHSARVAENNSYSCQLKLPTV